MAISFLFLFLIYMLLYVSTAFGRQIPQYLIPALTLFLTISISFCQLINMRLSLSKTDFAVAWLLFAGSILLLSYSVWAAIDMKVMWIEVTVLGAATFIYDACAFLKQAKKKTFTGSIFKDKQFKINAMLLLDKLLVLPIACVILFFPFKNENSSSAAGFSFHFFAAILTFTTAYMTVTAAFHGEFQKKKRHKKFRDSTNNLGVIEKLNRLMEEEKPYLDCELSLEKMAQMLDLSENELTRLLNHEMDTSFYNLVNDYRMETILQILKEPSSRRFTIMASAYESGFNSKSTFYRIFKEYTGISPREYLSKD